MQCEEPAELGDGCRVIVDAKVDDPVAEPEKPTPLGFKYTNRVPGGAVKNGYLKKTPSGVFFIKFGISGTYGPLNVVPPNPGTDGGFILAIGGGDTYCSNFGGAAGGTVTNEPAGNPFKLFAVKNATAETACLP
jgi:hypothetical protein